MAVKMRKKPSQEFISYKDGETKVRFRFDKSFLNMVIIFIFTKSRSITRATLQNIRKLFSITDTSLYMNNAEMYARIEFIRKALDCKLSKGIVKRDIIIEECREENNEENQKIIDMIRKEPDLIQEEIKAINKQVTEKVRYGALIYFKDILKEQIYKIEMNDFKSYSDIASRTEEILSCYLNELRKIKGSISTDVFSLRDENYGAYITNLVKKVTDPNASFRTGIKYLNDMLSPGFMPGRLYLFLGLTGGYKSSMLLQCARWIKLFNDPIIKRKDADATPTVLLITTENSVEETVIRLFNMSVGDRPINDYEPDEAIKALRSTGKLTITDKNPTDIVIKYYANNDLDTNDLYGVIEELEEDNREVIALIFDYIKCIRPAEKATDERIQLKNVSNELKTLAIRLDIPVITANQINRAGNTAIDAAASEGKEDLARMLGRSNIAVSWDLLENVDWAAIINIEREKRTKILYLTIKRIKIRYKDEARYSYINHPFYENSTIRLIDDIFETKPLSKESLSSDMEGVSQIGSKGMKTVSDRQTISSRQPEKATLDDFFSHEKRLNKRM